MSNDEHFSDSSFGISRICRQTSKTSQLITDQKIQSRWGSKKSPKLTIKHSALLTGPISRNTLPKVSVRLEVQFARFGFLSSPPLDPALVWSEFLGVISGSEASLDTPNRCMDRESYQKLSNRTQATFTSRRGVIYDLFQAYVKQKRESRTYDVADRCAEVDSGYSVVLISLTGRMLSCKRYKFVASLGPVSISCPY